MKRGDVFDLVQEWLMQEDPSHLSSTRVVRAIMGFPCHRGPDGGPLWPGNEETG